MKKTMDEEVLFNIDLPPLKKKTFPAFYFSIMLSLETNDMLILDSALTE